jgi:nucleotide-binding universal stress UspA family protein
MKKVLIAMDYAPSAQKVAEQGYEIAKAMNADVVLLHVVEDVGYYSNNIYDPIMGFGGFTNDIIIDNDALLKIEKEANGYLSKAKSHLRDENIQTKVLHGEITERILETAKKEHCDLIVIGTHSRSGIEEFFLGSNAHSLIKQVTTPLFIIPIKTK